MLEATSADDALMSIGEVLDELRTEFEGLSISKIRFLEGHGLISPLRTAGGYRKYSLVDRERLRYVLRMQRDHFLPLRVIREHLDAIDRGLTPPAASSAQPRAPRSLESTDALFAHAAPTSVRLTREEIAAESGLSAADTASLIDFGIIVADTSGHFDGLALQSATVAARLRVFGLEARHLKTVLASAAREVDLVAPVLTAATRGRKPADRAQAEELRLQLVNALVELHALLVRSLIDRE